MTIKFSKEIEGLIEKALASGNFESAEHVIRYSLGRTLTEQDIFEDEAFAKRVKAGLARAEEDIKAGRVYSVPHGQLADFIAERNQDRIKARD